VISPLLMDFAQYLEEDPRTNRIDDSLQLFTQICANPLLKNVHLVLFLSESADGVACCVLELITSIC